MEVTQLYSQCILFYYVKGKVIRFFFPHPDGYDLPFAAFVKEAIFAAIAFENR
jgi:hypothetical protein